MRTTIYYLFAAFFAVSGLLQLAFGGASGVGGALIAFVFAGCFMFAVTKRKKAAALESERKSHYGQLFDRVSKGELQTARPQNMFLRDGETAHFCSIGSLVEEKTTAYQGGGASVRVRVAKGVSVSTGAGRGHAVRELVQVSRGELAITNERIVFAGDLKSFEEPIKKLTNVQPLTDGIIFHVGTKSHYVRLPNQYEPLIAKATLDAMLA